MTGKPTVLDLLAARADAAPAGVIVSGETLDARARAGIGAGLHCPVSSLYTLAEVGIAGSECPDVATPGAGRACTARSSTTSWS
ncbi:hypothetical protein StrepF001_01095 [Streptomyces sp. F001]|nr:hypothetical protein StrepF001_01095 [Streptomyces sp. F001]